MTAISDKHEVVAVVNAHLGANGIECGSHYFIHPAPIGNRHDSRLLGWGITPGVFTSRDDAIRAGELAGMKRARELSGEGARLLD
jgi:hypothetical protein